MPYVPPTKVVKLAPDALVYINGDLYAPVGQGLESKTKNVYNTVMSISINASIDPSPNTCSIQLADPRTGDQPWFLNEQIFTIGPMAEVEVLMKGRFFHNGEPVYYPVFWGLVSSVTKTFAGGFHSVQLDCSDMLRWWEMTYVNNHPSFLDAQILQGVEWTGYVSRFSLMNPFEIILSLSKLSMANMFADFKTIDTAGLSKNDKATQRFSGDPKELLKHWQDRFSTLGTVVRIYGMGGEEIQENNIHGKHISETDGAPHRPAEGNKGSAKPTMHMPIYEPSEERLAEVQMYAALGSAGDLVESDYQTRLSIAADVANLIGYEFYQDVNGEIIFKPPFWNMNVKNNKPVSHIEDIDIINWSITDSEQAINCTRMDIFGSYSEMTASMESKVIKPRATLIDYSMASRYGIRPQARESQFFRTPRACFFYGVTEMDKANIQRFSSNMTIPLRPELRLGYPIYIAAQDCFMYIYGLSHTVDFAGMTAVTTLSLSGLRRKYKPSSEIDTEMTIKSGDQSLGNRSIVAVPKYNKLNTTENFNTQGSAVYGHKPDAKDTEKSKGLESVVHWTMVQDKTPGIGGSGSPVVTKSSYPVSDEEGYEVIGGFRYGRGIPVNPVGGFTKADDGHIFEKLAPESLEDNPASPPVKGRPISRVGDATQDPNHAGKRLDSLGPNNS